MQTPDLAAKITTETSTSSANAATSITKAADANEVHALHSIACSFSASPTGATVSVSVGGSTVFSMYVVGTELLVDLDKPIYGSKNEALVVTLSAGGSGITGKLNVQTS